MAPSAKTAPEGGRQAQSLPEDADDFVLDPVGEATLVVIARLAKSEAADDYREQMVAPGSRRAPATEPMQMRPFGRRARRAAMGRFRTLASHPLRLLPSAPAHAACRTRA
jgi:hypothetical protein